MNMIAANNILDRLHLDLRDKAYILTVLVHSNSQQEGYLLHMKFFKRIEGFTDKGEKEEFMFLVRHTHGLTGLTNENLYELAEQYLSGYLKKDAPKESVHVYADKEEEATSGKEE